MDLRERHLGALDGLRALAVLAVIGFHFAVPGFGGGFVGVDVFFVLSGFLITSLLLEEHAATGRIALGAFWLRRARRLLPGLFFMVGVVSLVPLVGSLLHWPLALDSVDLSRVRGDALASLAYLANWFQISLGSNYFTQWSPPNVLAHTWSLAIEEQFYLVWPILTTVLIRGGLVRRRSWGVAVTVTVAVVSLIAMALLYGPSPAALARVYFGADTRLFDLAGGAALAWWVAGRELVCSRRHSAAGWSSLAALGVATLVGGVASESSIEPRSWMFRGGFLLVTVATISLLLALSFASPRLSCVLSWRPLRLVGRVSYGLYLWHWPIAVFVTPEFTGCQGGELLALRTALLVTVTTLSFVAIEQPFRRRRSAGARRRFVAVVGSLAVILAATTLPSTRWESTPASAAPEAVAARFAGGPAAPRNEVLGHSTRQWSPRESGRVRVLVLGDSLTYYAYPAIAAALSGVSNVTLRNGSAPGSGLTTSQWRQSYGLQLLVFHPNVVIFSTYWDGPLARTHPARYGALLDDFVGFLTTRGVSTVIMEGLPAQLGSAWLSGARGAGAVTQRKNAEDAAWDSVVRLAVVRHPGSVVYFNAAARISTTSSWMTRGGVSARVRMRDGTHLCLAGNTLFASDMARNLEVVLGISPPVKTTWWTQPFWLATFPLAPIPAGMCPRDSPH
jgi:peptidoglycan/LPS O-acetylase OafA/YrhL